MFEIKIINKSTISFFVIYCYNFLLLISFLTLLLYYLFVTEIPPPRWPFFYTFVRRIFLTFSPQFSRELLSLNFKLLKCYCLSLKFPRSLFSVAANSRSPDLPLPKVPPGFCSLEARLLPKCRHFSVSLLLSEQSGASPGGVINYFPSSAQSGQEAPTSSRKTPKNVQKYSDSHREYFWGKYAINSDHHMLLNVKLQTIYY